MGITLRLYIVATFCLSAVMTCQAGLYPPIDDNVGQLAPVVAKSDFVCKGEIVSAPEVRSINGPLPRRTGVATARIDRCVKGDLSGTIHLASDEFRPSGGWGGGGHIFTPTRGEYLLLFLKQDGDLYELVDDRGALPISRLFSRAGMTADPLLNLENDLKAGLADDNREMVLRSICWLGHLDHLSSTRELHAQLPGAGLLERLYLWEALLRVGDVSVIGDVGEYVSHHLPAVRSYFLPRDRVPQMQGRVFDALCNTADKSVVPYLESFTNSPDPNIRVHAEMGLRKIGSLGSAPVFLRLLDDHQQDIDFIAAMSLIELAGGGAIDWIWPSFEEFTKNPDFYAAKCREWWKATGEAKARSLSLAK